MYKIVPVTLPIFGAVDTLHINVLPFNLFPSTITLIYQLSGQGGMFEKNMTLPEEVVAVWGTDDTVVLDYVLTTLGLELAPEPETPGDEPEAGE